MQVPRCCESLALALSPLLVVLLAVCDGTEIVHNKKVQNDECTRRG